MSMVLVGHFSTLDQLKAETWDLWKIGWITDFKVLSIFFRCGGGN